MSQSPPCIVLNCCTGEKQYQIECFSQKQMWLCGLAMPGNAQMYPDVWKMEVWSNSLAIHKWETSICAINNKRIRWLFLSDSSGRYTSMHNIHLVHAIYVWLLLDYNCVCKLPRIQETFMYVFTNKYNQIYILQSLKCKKKSEVSSDVSFAFLIYYFFHSFLQC